MHTVLYTKPGCHLCDHALELLRQNGVEPEIINIETDPARHQDFTHCIPVVEIDSKVRFRGKVHPRLLKRLLRARNSHDSQ